MYFRSIQFFFRVWALVNNNSGGDKRNVCHSLAYVHWYKFAKKNHALGLNIISKRFYKQGHLISVHRLVKRDSLVPLGQNWLVVELWWPVDFIASSMSECCCFQLTSCCNFVSHIKLNFCKYNVLLTISCTKQYRYKWNDWENTRISLVQMTPSQRAGPNTRRLDCIHKTNWSEVEWGVALDMMSKEQ